MTDINSAPFTTSNGANVSAVGHLNSQSMKYEVSGFAHSNDTKPFTVSQKTVSPMSTRDTYFTSAHGYLQHNQQNYEPRYFNSCESATPQNIGYTGIGDTQDVTWSYHYGNYYARHYNYNQYYNDPSGSNYYYSNNYDQLASSTPYPEAINTRSAPHTDFSNYKIYGHTFESKKKELQNEFKTAPLHNDDTHKPNHVAASSVVANRIKRPSSSLRVEDLDAERSTKRARRNRTNFTKHQLDILETVFSRGRYPDIYIREELATNLEIKEEVVRVWFKNARAKLKRSAAKEERLMVKVENIAQPGAVEPVCLPGNKNTSQSSVLSKETVEHVRLPSEETVITANAAHILPAVNDIFRSENHTSAHTQPNIDTSHQGVYWSDNVTKTQQNCLPRQLTTDVTSSSDSTNQRPSPYMTNSHVFVIEPKQVHDGYTYSS